MDTRIDEILQDILSMANGDFDISIRDSETTDQVDAIGIGIGILAEELKSTMISKKHLEKALNDKEKALDRVEEYQFALDNSAIVAHTDLKGTITYVNDMFCRLSKYSRKELIGKNQNIVNSAYHPKSFWKEMWSTIGNGQLWHGNIRNKAKDDSIYWVYTTIIPFKENDIITKYVSIRQDITKHIEAEELILKTAKESLNEKDTLLKEIHHRVKNNLQVITSLLSLQSSSIKDAKMKDLFKYSQYRINSMAMVHEMLYHTENLSKIKYNDYIETLSNKLISAFKGPNSNIDLIIESGDIEVNIDTAIPLGLLINEILTNSLKYGIIDKGSIYVNLKQLVDKNYVLKIGDDGIGYDDSINFRNQNSLGLKLMHNLARQLGGNIEKDNSKPGTNYILTFKEIKPIN